MRRPRSLRIGDTEVPRIGLGTNRLQDTAEHAAFVRDAIAAGIRHIDTARLYSRGGSEAAIGAALASGRPEGVVVATKGGYHDGRPETIAREIEESLRALRADRIDLYYLHRVHDDVAIEDSLAAIVRARDRGRIAHIGVSNVDLAQLARARAVTEVAAVQNHYNLAHREHDDVLEHCAAEGIAFVPYFPLRDETPALHDVAARHRATPLPGRACLAAAALGDDAADPRHAVDPARAREPRRARARPERRRHRRTRCPPSRTRSRLPPAWGSGGLRGRSTISAVAVLARRLLRRGESHTGLSGTGPQAFIPDGEHGLGPTDG